MDGINIYFSWLIARNNANLNFMWGPLRHWQCSEDNINSTKTTIEIQGHSFCMQYTTDKHIVRAIQCINLRMVVSNDILGLCQFLSGCLYYSCFVFLTVELHARIEKKNGTELTSSGSTSQMCTILRSYYGAFNISCVQSS